MGWAGAAMSHLQSLSKICDLKFLSQAPTLMMESETSDPILEFASLGPNIQHSQYQAMWGYWLARAVQL